MIIILIVSFVRTGDPPISYQNNAFLIILVNSIFFGLDFKVKPFGIWKLNYLNYISSLMVIAITFGGLFSSINQENNLPFLIMILIMILSIYFILLFVQNYIQNILAFPKANKFYSLLNRIFGKCWEKGRIYFKLTELP